MLINSPLQATVKSIKINVDSMQMRNKATINNLKDSIRKLENASVTSNLNSRSHSPVSYLSPSQIERNTYSRDGLNFDYRKWDHSSDNNFNSNNNKQETYYDYKCGYDTSKRYNNFNIHRQNQNQNHSTSRDYNYEYNTRKTFNDQANSKLDNLNHDIERLKLQVSELEKTKSSLEQRLPKGKETSSSYDRFNYLTDREFIEEIGKIIGTNKKSEIIKEIKTKLNTQKIKEEFINKTISLSKQATNKESNLISTWRWIKGIYNDSMDYSDVKALTRSRFSLSESKNIKRVIMKCVDYTYTAKKKVGKIKKLLLTEPNSRSQSPHQS